MIYKYSIETLVDDKISIAEREVIVKSVPLVDEKRLAYIQRRLFAVLERLENRFCKICMSGSVQEIDEKNASFFRRILSIFRKPRKVWHCSHCGIVPNHSYIFGYEILQQIMEACLVDALRAHPDRVELINEMTIEQQAEVLSLYLGLNFKRKLYFANLADEKNFNELINGKNPESANAD